MSVRRALALTATAAALAFGSLPTTGASPAFAQVVAPDEARALALADLLGMDAIFAVMAEEGASYGDEIANSMFPGQGLGRWTAAVTAIYDTTRMAERFDAAFVAALGSDPEALAAAETFFGGALGQEILKLEVEARRVLLDEAAEEAANVEAQKMQEDRDPRLRLIARLIEAGDLIEMNVAAALNASLAFTRGMVEEGPADGVPLDEMMADIWGQESVVRADAGAWLISYMALAYGSLSDRDLEIYIEFSDSEAGRRVNAALFSAFDAVFTPISRELGRAAARHAQSDDI